jgi:hypothetical protein
MHVGERAHLWGALEYPHHRLQRTCVRKEREGGRECEGGREREGEGGRGRECEGGREGGRQGGREGGRKGGRVFMSMCLFTRARARRHNICAGGGERHTRHVRKTMCGNTIHLQILQN